MMRQQYYIAFSILILFIKIINCYSLSNIVNPKDNIINSINCKFLENLHTQIYIPNDFILNIEAVNSNEFQKGTISENYNMFENSDLEIYQSCEQNDKYPFNIVRFRIQGSFVNINRFVNLIHDIKQIQLANPPNKNKLIQDAWNNSQIIIRLIKVPINQTKFSHVPFMIFIFLGLCIFGGNHYIVLIGIILYRIIAG